AADGVVRGGGGVEDDAGAVRARGGAGGVRADVARLDAVVRAGDVDAVTIGEGGGEVAEDESFDRRAAAGEDESARGGAGARAADLDERRAAVAGLRRAVDRDVRGGDVRELRRRRDRLHSRADLELDRAGGDACVAEIDAVSVFVPATPGVTVTVTE